MIPSRSHGAARRRRLIDRVAGLAVVLGLSAAATPVPGFAADWPLTAAGETSFAVLDLSQVGEALGRGELPVELLVAGSLVALAVGLAVTLLVGTLRRRRGSARRSDQIPAAASGEDIDTRTTLPWPVQDVDVFQPAPFPTVDEEEEAGFRQVGPNAPLDAAAAETWAAHEARLEVAQATSGRHPYAALDGDPEQTAATSQPATRAAAAEATETAGARESDAAVDRADPTGDAPPTWQRTEPPLRAAALAAIESTVAPRADAAPARSMLGTPDAPLVVELHDERENAAGRRVGPNLPIVAAIGTVAAGVAFAAGAAVGAALGVGAGAAIGLAFAGGAGVAIGAAVALLGGGRR